MPKVTTKEAKGPLQQAALAPMDVEADLPTKPNLSALSAKEQNGMKVEFRRVRMQRASSTFTITTLTGCW